MKNVLRNKKGFTLVEILIVIAIVGLLSTLAVNGYMEYRKSAVLSLSGDNLISIIDQLKSRTMNGDNNADRYDSIKAELSGEDVVDGSAAAASTASGNAKCFGLYFEENADAGGFDLYSFEQDFKGKKTWNKENDWVYEGCGEFNKSDEDVLIEPVILDKDIRISELTDANDVNVGNLALRFSPPDAALEVKLGPARPFTNDFTNFSAVNISMNYLNDTENVKVVNFDFKTKHASKKTD